MKKILHIFMILLLALAVLLTFASCGESDVDTSTNSETGTNSNIETEESSETDSNTETDSNVETEESSDTDTSASEECEHVLTLLPAVSPSCTQTGLTEGLQCSKCNQIITKQYEISSLGHGYVDHEAKEPTCADIGWEEYQTCSRCDYTTYEEIGAFGHTYETVVIDPTYESDGYTEHTCKVCGDSYKDSYTDCITFTVTWSNYDGTLLECDENVKYGQIPSFDGATPTKESDEENTYEFSGWSPEVKETQGDIQYVAVYIEHKKSLLEYVLSSDGDYYIVFGIGEEANTRNLKIPSTYNGKPVKEIADYAFSNCDKILTIEIPSTVTKIGNNAFEYCLRLQELIVPDSVEEYGNQILLDCPSIKKIYLPYCNTVLGEVFGSVVSYDTYNTPEVNKEGFKNVTYSCEYYYRVEGFYKVMYERGTYYRYPSSLTEVGLSRGVVPGKFMSGRMEKIVLGKDVTRIRYDAISVNELYYKGTMEDWFNMEFYDYSCVYVWDDFYILDNNDEWSKVTKLEIPNTVTTLDSQLHGFSNVEEVIIPNSVTSIKSNAFYFFSSLVNIVIPDSVTLIEESAFYYCKNLEHVIIVGDCVISIETYAFFDCDSLTTVYCEAQSEPSGCDISYNSVVFGIKDFGKTEDGFLWVQLSNDEILITLYTGDASSVTIPEKIKNMPVTALGKMTFYGCGSIESLVIPNSVTTIGSYAFSGCTSLTYNEYDNAYYLGNDTNKYLVLVKATAEDIISCEINQGTNVIYSYAFYNCTSLTSVKYLGKIEDWCNISFADSTANPLYNGASLYLSGELVTELVIPNTVTEIKAYAFYNCTSLTSIVIPDSVTTIGNYAFCKCTSLTSIEIPDSVTTIGERAFSSCTSLTIYCDAQSQPSGWATSWNYSNRPVVWGHTHEYENGTCICGKSEN